MSWHLIVTQGVKDTFSPTLLATDPRLLIQLAHPTSPWRVGNDVESVIAETLQATPSPVVSDLARLAIAVYTADLRVPRNRSNDRWQRDLVLHLPVSDPRSWKKALPALHELLAFLSGDNWEVSLRTLGDPARKSVQSQFPIDDVCLFSGGLDSLVGAIDLLAQGKRVALVSHHGRGESAMSIQERVVATLNQHFPDLITHVPFFTHPERGNTNEGENTMRARSFLFMAVGIAVATVSRTNPALTVAENGLISLNVPLTGPRSGSLSTRTTHPHYVGLYRRLLATLEIDVELLLPYRHRTKGEMLQEATHQAALASAAPLTMSCSHPNVVRFVGATPGTHCGYCVPCIIRLASLQAAKIADTPPHWDVLRNPPPSSSDRADDLRALRIALERLKGTDARHDVFQIMRSGPIPPDEARDYAAVYRRGMAEVGAFLGVSLV